MQDSGLQSWWDSLDVHADSVNVGLGVTGEQRRSQVKGHEPGHRELSAESSPAEQEAGSLYQPAIGQLFSSPSIISACVYCKQQQSRWKLLQYGTPFFGGGRIHFNARIASARANVPPKQV